MSDRSARGDKKAGQRSVPALVPAAAATAQPEPGAAPAATPDPAAVPMQVASLSMDPITSMPIVILTAPDPQATPGPTAGLPLMLSISIGLVEASAIASELEEVRLERPMTHDLMRNLLVQSGVTVRAVDVCDLRDGVYYACITLERDGVLTRVDSRPSDAIALALRMRVAVRVARRLLAETPTTERRRSRRKLAAGSQIIKPHDTSPEPDPGRGRGRGNDQFGSEAAELSLISAELLASMSDEDFGKWKM